MSHQPDPLESDDPSDASLLKRLQSGDHDAATEIYLRYATRLIGIANRSTSDDLATRVDPEDIVQSVFRTFFRRATDGHYTIPEGDELWKLLLVIALNKVRLIASHHRCDKRSVNRTRSLASHEPSGAGSDATSILQLTVDDLLAKLPENHRQAIELRMKGFEIAEIADSVSISRRSVERILQTFRERLLAEMRKPE